VTEQSAQGLFVWASGFGLTPEFDNRQEDPNPGAGVTKDCATDAAEAAKQESDAVE
jgi:hypothetical protein